MSQVFKKTASAVLLIVAIVLTVDYFWKDATLRALATDLNNWAVVIGAFALGLAPTA